MHVASLLFVSVIQWNTGSLTGVCDHSYAYVYTQGLGTLTSKSAQHFWLEKPHCQFHVVTCTAQQSLTCATQSAGKTLPTHIQFCQMKNIWANIEQMLSRLTFNTEKQNFNKVFFNFTYSLEIKSRPLRQEPRQLSSKYTLKLTKASSSASCP